MAITECLCDKAKEISYLRVGREKVCKIQDGKGSCGEDFYEDDDSPCRWCCQILRKDD